MVGNVNNIVDSMFAADSVKNQQSTASAKVGNFSDYLDSALFNYRTGLLTGGLSSGYSYLNPLTGSAWQTVVLEALRDELKKNQEEKDSENVQQEGDHAASQSVQKKKPSWATIRVIERYKSPLEEEVSGKKGLLV